MKKIRHFRFRILCLVLTLLSAGLWCTSYFNLAFYHRRSLTIVLLSRGAIEWTYQRAGSWQEEAMQRTQFSLSYPQTIQIGGFSGFGTYWKPKRIDYGLGMSQVTIPLWIPTSFFLAILCVSWALPAYRRRKRRQHGLCLVCAYDLTGNVSSICPECGAKVEREENEASSASLVG